MAGQTSRSLFIRNVILLGPIDYCAIIAASQSIFYYQLEIHLRIRITSANNVYAIPY